MPTPGHFDRSRSSDVVPLGHQGDDLRRLAERLHAVIAGDTEERDALEAAPRRRARERPVMTTTGTAPARRVSSARVSAVEPHLVGMLAEGDQGAVEVEADERTLGHQGGQAFPAAGT